MNKNIPKTVKSASSQNKHFTALRDNTIRTRMVSVEARVSMSCTAQSNLRLCYSYSYRRVGYGDWAHVAANACLKTALTICRLYMSHGMRFPKMWYV